MSVEFNKNWTWTSFFTTPQPTVSLQLLNQQFHYNSSTNCFITTPQPTVSLQLLNQQFRYNSSTNSFVTTPQPTVYNNNHQLPSTQLICYVVYVSVPLVAIFRPSTYITVTVTTATLLTQSGWHLKVWRYKMLEYAWSSGQPELAPYPVDSRSSSADKAIGARNWPLTVILVECRG